MPSPSLPVTDPIELKAPDITPYRQGNTGIDYVTTLDSGRAGPHVMISAIVHGNELCGPIALEWLFQQNARPLIGKLSLVFVNIDAYEIYDPKDPSASRWFDEDFNRVWSEGVLNDPERDSAELRRARTLRPFLDSVDLLLDIHSMQRLAPPVMMAGPLAKGRELALAVGYPSIVINDTGHKAGKRMRDYSGFSDPTSAKNAVLVECGQHWEAAAADVAKETSVRFLRATGIVDETFAGGLYSEQLPPQSLAEVTDVVTIQSDEFVFARDFLGGEILSDKGTPIGRDGETDVLTPYDNCMLVMPTRRNYKGQTAVRLARVIENA